MNIIGISGLNNSVAFKKREFPNLSAREQRIVQGFDAAAALVTGEGVQAVAAEERFTRRKATGAFPVHAIEFCLRAGGLTPDSIDYVAHGFSYEPHRSSYQYDEFARRRTARPVWRRTEPIPDPHDLAVVGPELHERRDRIGP